MSVKIEAALFDYGGVFTVSPFGAVEKIGLEMGADPAALLEAVFGPYHSDTDHPWHRLERGEVDFPSAREEIIAIGRERGVDSDPLKLLAAMGGGAGPHEVVIECVRGLRRDGLKTGMITNNAAEFREHWRKTLPLDELFHDVVDSSEVGMRKPDPGIYLLALERLGGVDPDCAVFLDDYEGNIVAAREVGMHGVLVGSDPSGAVAELHALLGASRADMRFVISTSFGPLEHLAEIALAAEECGYEALTFSDHVVHPETIDTPYPYTEDGSRRWEAFTDWPDPWVAIGHLSAITTRLRFTNNVFVLPMRNPFFAAKAISTAAVLSRGRVTLTIGVGWSNVEFGLVEQEFRKRGARTDEMIEVMRKLWTGEMVEHHGQFYDFDRLEMSPAPPARIPIWVGGISQPALRRAARNDGWLSDLQTSAEIAECIQTVQAHRVELGRADEPFDVMASASDAFELGGYQRLGDAGVTHVLTMPWVFYGGATDDLGQKLEGIRRYADDIIAKMR